MDDNSINTKVFDKMLHDLNVKHLCVNSGAEAIEAFEQSVTESKIDSTCKAINLIFMDIEMPSKFEFFQY